MLEIFYSNFKNYWRDIDKTIFLSFLILFILGTFFSFSSTSTLAGERLNKDYYFFFSKHLVFATSSIFLMILISWVTNQFFKKDFDSCFLSIINNVIPSFIFWCRDKRIKTMVGFNCF